MFCKSHQLEVSHVERRVPEGLRAALKGRSCLTSSGESQVRALVEGLVLQLPK